MVLVSHSIYGPAFCLRIERVMPAGDGFFPSVLFSAFDAVAARFGVFASSLLRTGVFRAFLAVAAVTFGTAAAIAGSVASSSPLSS